MAEKTVDPNIERLMDELEEQVRKECGSPICVTFWGTIILNPNKAWVTREQSERSMKEIEHFIAQREKAQKSPT